MRNEGLSTLTIAHLSDIHLGPMPRIRVRDLTLKRMTGLANWHRGRKRRHLPQVLATVTADIHAQRPDHIVVTGDLCNVGLPQEHAAAFDWLERLGPPGHVTVIPGNHDTYVPLRRDPGIARWVTYMTGEEPFGPIRRGESVSFPFVRRLGGVALVGLSSAVPSRMFRATGELGPEQCQAAAQVLASLGNEGLVRIVLIHHPPLPGQSPPAGRLIDATAFTEVLRMAGAELVLHGHNHQATVVETAGVTQPIPVVGVPSASHARHHGHNEPARYNLYRIETGAGPVRITLEGRAIAEGQTNLRTVETRELTVRR